MSSQERMKMQEISARDKFNELFTELEHCSKDVQKQKIEEINEMLDEMDEEEFNSIFSKEMFDKIDQMIEEKKLTLANAILLLKYIGYWKGLIKMWSYNFDDSKLIKRIEKMIAEEEKKKEGKNEKLLVDLCECFIMLRYIIPPELFSIFFPCLLKVMLKKEKNEGTQKEVEMASLALSQIVRGEPAKQELYLNEIKEIILYHQKRRNLTRLAYQSAWFFLAVQLHNDRFLKEVMVIELHFIREAIRELEELTKSIDWKREKEERGKEAKESQEIRILVRWLHIMNFNFFPHTWWNEEYSRLVNNIVQIFRAAKHNYTDICGICTLSFMYVAGNSSVKIEDLLKSGAVDAVLEEIQRPTLNDNVVNGNAQFFMNISNRSKKKGDVEKEKAKRKVFSKIIEKMEEEGYEDDITSFCELFDFLGRKYFSCLSLNISKYFVNV